MVKKNDHFHEYKVSIIEGLELIQISLVHCVEEGMLDTDDSFYNEVLELLSEAHAVNTWTGITEIISRAKTVENDVAVWLARHGRTTISFSWPKIVSPGLD